MKSIVKIVTIAAVLATLTPVHAMFNRFSATFLPKRYTPMYLNRKPLITLGALLGTASITAGKPMAKAKALYNCDSDLADFTRWAIQARNNDDDLASYYQWLKARFYVFNYCEKIVASRDEIYNRNIANALYEADQQYTLARQSESWGSKDSARKRFMWGHEYSEVAEKLKQEQAQERNK